MPSIPASIHIGIIGAGRWASNILRTLQDFPNVNVAWVARTSGQPFDMLPVDAQLVTDWRFALSNKERVDAVISAVPPKFHREIAEAVAKIGLPLWLEKPLALSIEDAVAIRRAFTGSQDHLFVDHTYLFNPAFRHLQDLIKTAGHIESIETLAGNWGPFRKDAGVFWDWAPHDVSMVLAIKAQMPAQFDAITKESRFLETGLGEHIVLDAEFDDGTCWHSDISNIRRARVRTLKVTCTGATYMLEDDQGTRIWREDDGYRYVIFETHAKPLHLAVANFLQMVESGRDADATAVLGERVVRMLATAQP